MKKQEGESQLNMKDSGNLPEGNVSNESSTTKEAAPEQLSNKQEHKFKISSLELNIKQLENQLIQAEQSVEKYRDELYSVYTSRSWRYTAFFRKTDRLLWQVLFLFYHSFIRKIIKTLYLLLPLRIRNSSFIDKLKNDIKDNEI